MDLLLAFLEWMGRMHGAQLCSPGYAGEMLNLGPDEIFVREFLDQRKIHAPGAPGDEIEITPEMLLAGSREMENYYLGDGRYCIQYDGLASIYVAMVRAVRS